MSSVGARSWAADTEMTKPPKQLADITTITDPALSLDRLILHAMSSSEVGPSTTRPTVEEEVPSEHESSSESDAAPADDSGKAAGKAKKKKKKKKSKAAKLIAAARGNDVPDEIIGEVLKQVQKEDEHKNVDEEEVRKALQAMKVMDMLKGKTGLGGKNAKDLGEHKVSSLSRLFYLA